MLKNLTQTNGVPFKQIFLAGHSCGAWNAIRYAAFKKELFGGTIAFNPNCWPSEENNPVRQYLVDELKTAEHANSLVFASPDDLTHDWKATSTDLKWIADIPGIKWFEYDSGPYGFISDQFLRTLPESVKLVLDLDLIQILLLLDIIRLFN